MVFETISKTRRRATIPRSKLRVGDIVALKEYSLYYEKETLHYTGIIVGISKWFITLCLSDADETTTIASSPKLIESCQM